MPLFIDVLALAAVLVAVIRIATTDTALWAHGVWSKAGWTLLVLWLAWSTPFGILPLGAWAAIWKTHRLHRSRSRWNQDGLDVPFAQGIPVPFERPIPETADTEEES